MRFSKAFVPTLRDDPAEAEIISHKLMVRAGMLRKMAAGVYSWLPLGLRVLKRVERIVREEMDAIGCQEILMSALQPAELWMASGRWNAYGDEMMRLTDRHEREFCLGPTHEEMVTTLAKEIRSYRDLPLCLYQIQSKYRDEIRPRFGVMRSREFLMKDAYSFHLSQESLEETYQRMSHAYCRIIERCGLTYRSVKAAGGLIGGSVSEEFMVLAESGEDVVIYCPQCHYAANLETAVSKWHTPAPDEAVTGVAKVSTPKMASIEDVAAFLKVGTEKLVKTLVLKAGGRVVAALVPGNKEVNPSKLAAVLGVGEVIMFGAEDFAERPDLVSGFVGPVGLENVLIVADHSLKSMRNFIVGANEIDHHLTNVNTETDFTADIWADLVFAEVGEVCAECGRGSLERMRGIEVGHIFQLGTKYSRLLHADYVGEDGTTAPMVMGCYGVGVSRLAAAAIEQKNDRSGIIWPASIAPYDVSLIGLGKVPTLVEAAEKIYGELKEEFSVLYDDRQVSPGIKFSDADLIGIPIQVIVGKKFAESGKLETKIRATGARVEVGPTELADWIKETLGALTNA